MVEKKSGQDCMKDWIASASPEVQAQFPEYKKEVQGPVEVKRKCRFRTKYDPLDNPHYETFDPAENLTEPGRSESLKHLVERLTHKPNATMRQLTAFAIQTNQDFEDPSQLSESEIEDRFNRTVAVGDNVEAAEALAEAVNDFSSAQVKAVADEEKRARTKDEQATTKNAAAFTVSGASGQTTESASDSG